MQKNHANQAKHVEHAESVAESAMSRPDTEPAGCAETSPTPNPADRCEELAAGLDDLAAAPTEVLADWVTARGRCLWETTFGDLPDWLGDGNEPDRELATRLCAGCPVRAECLELELRVAGERTPSASGVDSMPMIGSPC